MLAITMQIISDGCSTLLVDKLHLTILFTIRPKMVDPSSDFATHTKESIETDLRPLSPWQTEVSLLKTMYIQVVLWDKVCIVMLEFCLSKKL